MNMHEASSWRYALAQRLAPQYAQHPKVEAVEVGGSVSRNQADRFSDIELGIFWSESPSDEERSLLIEQAGGQVRSLHPYDSRKQVWEDVCTIRGVEIDVCHMTVESMDHLLRDVVEHADPDILKQYMISAILHALPLFGTALLNDWKSRTLPYPDALARAVIRGWLLFTPAWSREVLAQRGDLLVLYDSYCFAQKRILTLLLALNRVYHPGFKWMASLIEQLPLAPSHLSARLKQVFQMPPDAGTQLLHTLIEETFTLIERQIPELSSETAKARAHFQQEVQFWDQAPEHIFEHPEG
jgi:hypothetical protein